MMDEKLLTRKVRWGNKWITIEELASDMEVNAKTLASLVFIKKLKPMDALEVILHNPNIEELFNFQYEYKGVPMTEEELCLTTGTTPEFLEHCKSEGISTSRIIKLLERGITSLDELPITRKTRAEWCGVELSLEEIATVSGVPLSTTIKFYVKHEKFPDEYSPEYLQEQAEIERARRKELYNIRARASKKRYADRMRAKLKKEREREQKKQLVNLNTAVKKYTPPPKNLPKLVIPPCYTPSRLKRK